MGSWFNFARARILSELHQEPMTISKLANKLKSVDGGYSRTNLYRYIEELKAKGLVSEIPATKKRGERVPMILYATPKAEPISKKFWEFHDLLKRVEDEDSSSGPHHSGKPTNRNTNKRHRYNTPGPGFEPGNPSNHAENIHRFALTQPLDMLKKVMVNGAQS